MKPHEKRELLIWAGGTALTLLIVNGWFLSGRAQRVQAAERSLESAYDVYQDHYGDKVDDAAVPVADALATYARARDDQVAALRVVELAMLGGAVLDRRHLDDRLAAEVVTALGPFFADELARSPGIDGADDRVVARFLAQSLQQARAQTIAREFVVDGQMVDFSLPVSYNAAGTIVGNTHTRLIRRAATAMVGFPGSERLPFHGAGAIAVGDGTDAALERGLQMAEVCCYATLADLVLEVFEFGGDHSQIISLETAGPAGRRSSPDGRYAVVGATMVLTAGYDAAKAIMERLYASHSGLFVRRFALRQEGDHGAFALELDVGLVIPHHEAWALSPWERADPSDDARRGRSRRSSPLAPRRGNVRRR